MFKSHTTIITNQHANKHPCPRHMEFFSNFYAHEMYSVITCPSSFLTDRDKKVISSPGAGGWGMPWYTDRRNVTCNMGRAGATMGRWACCLKMRPFGGRKRRELPCSCHCHPPPGLHRAAQTPSIPSSPSSLPPSRIFLPNSQVWRHTEHE